MSRRIYSRDFHIELNVPEEVFETFMAAQTKLLGIKGHIEKTAEGFKGYLEGDKEKMEKIQQLMEKTEKFVNKASDIVFSEVKEIQQYTCDKFCVNKDTKNEKKCQ